MKKHSLAILVFLLSINNVHACWMSWGVPSPFLGIHLTILVLALGFFFASFIVKDLRQYKFRWLIALIATIIVLFEVFVVTGGFAFSQCINSKNFDSKKIIIPKIDFNRATSTVATSTIIKN